MMRSQRSMLGVTLLEVMLVLSIVALIILMSVRYYQATTNASQTEQVMAQIQAITAAADNIAMGSSGGYSGATSGAIIGLAGTGVLVSPWGGAITISGNTSTSYQVSIPGSSSGVCTNVTNKLAANPKYSAPATCSNTSGIVYTYVTTS